MTPRFTLEPLSTSHDRATFECGNDRIDAHFRTTASQDVGCRYAACFVALDSAKRRVTGFYTLSSTNVALSKVPSEMAKNLPRYPTIRAVLIDWLARGRDYGGLSLGRALPVDAIRTVLAAPIEARAVFADAIDVRDVSSRETFGFIDLTTRPRTLHLPLATAKDIVAL